mmetsp:Transcript_167725/g.533300  ORF Transcript_167725/g.533300 Transcript_167725/m.533300 type:complete len:504 (+) Transcript_167725:22-1533(+)
MCVHRKLCWPSAGSAAAQAPMAAFTLATRATCNDGGASAEALMAVAVPRASGTATVAGLGRPGVSSIATAPSALAAAAAAVAAAAMAATAAPPRRQRRQHLRRRPLRCPSAAREACEGPGYGCPFDVVQTPSRGKIAVANRPLAAGATVLEETPLLLLKLSTRVDEVVMEVASKFAMLSQHTKGELLGLCPASAESKGLEAALNHSQIHEGSLPQGVSLAHMRRVAKVLDCNGFVGAPSRQGLPPPLSLYEDETDGKALQGAVYSLISRFNHSCRPNVSKHFDTEERLSLRTLREVSEGEELSFSYMRYSDLLRCTAYRQKTLKAGWGFECNCRRCTVRVYSACAHSQRQRAYQAAVDDTRAFKCACCSVGVVLGGPSADGGLSCRPCGHCGKSLGEEDVRRSLQCEDTAAWALEAFQAAPRQTSLAVLLRAATEAEVRLASTHWARGLLNDAAQRLLRQMGRSTKTCVALPRCCTFEASSCVCVRCAVQWKNELVALALSFA